MAATAGTVTPVLITFIGHPETLTVFMALVADAVVTVSYWLWVLRRDRQRQRMVEALVRASNGQPGRIVLDSGGGIEVNNYCAMDSGEEDLTAGQAQPRERGNGRKRSSETPSSLAEGGPSRSQMTQLRAGPRAEFDPFLETQIGGYACASPRRLDQARDHYRA